MKNISLVSLFICFLSFHGLYSQTNDNQPVDSVKTLLGDGNMIFGLFGGPEFKFTQFRGDFAFMCGGKGGILINRCFSMGGGGYSLSTQHRIAFPNGTTSDDILFDYGGLILEYTTSPKEAVHTALSLLIGGGRVSYTTRTYLGDLELGSSGFFIFEPEISVEANIIEFIKVGVGGSYRFLYGADLAHIINNDLRGFSGNLYIKFGIDDLSKFIERIKDRFNFSEY